MKEGKTGGRACRGWSRAQAGGAAMREERGREGKGRLTASG